MVSFLSFAYPRAGEGTSNACLIGFDEAGNAMYQDIDGTIYVTDPARLGYENYEEYGEQGQSKTQGVIHKDTRTQLEKAYADIVYQYGLQDKVSNKIVEQTQGTNGAYELTTIGYDKVYLSEKGSTWAIESGDVGGNGGDDNTDNGQSDTGETEPNPTERETEPVDPTPKTKDKDKENDKGVGEMEFVRAIHDGKTIIDLTSDKIDERIIQDGNTTITYIANDTGKIEGKHGESALENLIDNVVIAISPEYGYEWKEGTGPSIKINGMDVDVATDKDGKTKFVYKDETSGEESEYEITASEESGIVYTGNGYEWWCMNHDDPTEFAGMGTDDEGYTYLTKLDVGRGILDHWFRHWGDHTMKIVPCYIAHPWKIVYYTVSVEAGTNADGSKAYDTVTYSSKVWGETYEVTGPVPGLDGSEPTYHDFHIPRHAIEGEGVRVSIGNPRDGLTHTDVIVDDDSQKQLNPKFDVETGLSK